jgi:hypothetical protein
MERRALRWRVAGHDFSAKRQPVRKQSVCGGPAPSCQSAQTSGDLLAGLSQHVDPRDAVKGGERTAGRGGSFCGVQRVKLHRGAEALHEGNVKCVEYLFRLRCSELIDGNAAPGFEKLRGGVGLTRCNCCNGGVRESFEFRQQDHAFLLVGIGARDDGRCRFAAQIDG